MGALKIKVGGEYITIRRGPRGPSGAIAGEIKIWPASELPAEGGYDWCRGAEVPRPIDAGGNDDTYKGVWDRFQTEWGAGNGTTTFNLPDLRLRAPIGVGTGRALGSTDGLAETARAAKWSHSHNHTASGSSSSSTSISGGISGAYTGVYTTATDTNHNHLGPADHGTGTGGQGTGTRLGPAPGHGSTSTAVQAGGQVHSHGIGDPTHAHGHTIGASTSTTTTVTVNNADSGNHPTAAVNYIIKL